MRPPPPSPAWARVRILLNLDDIPGATEAATASLKALSRRFTVRLGEAQAIGCPDLPPGWMYLNPRSRIAVVNLDVWRAHACRPALNDFAAVVTTLAAPTFARYDVREWEVLDEVTRIRAGF